jgi:hypothetical protein
LPALPELTLVSARERSQGRLKADRRPRHIPHQEIATKIIMILKSHLGMMSVVTLTTPFEAYI